MAIQKINGTDLTIKVDGIEVGCAGDITFTITTSTTSSTCRADGGWASNAAGRHSWTASTGGAIRIATGTDAAGNKTYKDFVALQIARTPVELEFGTDIVGDTTYTGMAIITSTVATSPEDGGATFTIEFTGDGAITPAVNS